MGKEQPKGAKERIAELEAIRSRHKEWVTELADLCGISPADMVDRMRELEAENQRLRHLIKHYRYHHGAFPAELVKAALEGE